MKEIKIRTANSKGYMLAHDGDGVDISTRMAYHRGTVQKQICHTIKAQLDVGVCVNEGGQQLASELKKELCNTLIENGLVEEGNMINHSYTNNRLNNVRPIDTIQNQDNNISATLTTRPDCLGVVVKVNKKNKSYVGDKYREFIDENGYIPQMFNPYNKQKIDDVAPAQTCECGSTTASSSVLIKENEDNLSKLEPKVLGGIGEKKSNNGTQYYQQNRIYDSEEIALRQSAHQEFNPYYDVSKKEKSSLRIRKLTPKECWRLMGFSQINEDRSFNDTAYNNAAEVCSEAQLYKQAGNSIVVNVLMAIFGELL